MKKPLLILLILLSKVALAQTAFYNAGSIEIHNGGQIGFHTDLQNDGSFESKNGLAGFYSNDEIYVTGENEISFYDVEIAVENNLQVFTSIEIGNTLNFINGKVRTPRNDKNITLSFVKDAIYAGEDDSHYVDGYASVRSDLSFVFPIGDNDRLRTATIDNNTNSQEFSAAYYFEDTNYSTILNKRFNTKTKDNTITEISTNEFWDVDGQAPVNITLTWDTHSNIYDLTSNIKNLIVVGWSRTDKEWKNLGKVEVTGDLNNGSVKSTTFFPDDYEALTIATGGNNMMNNADDVTVIQIRLFDITRRLVRTFKADETFSLNGIATGIYITDVYLSNGERYSKKVLNK